MDVGLGGHCIGNDEFAAGDRGVSRPLELNLDPLRNRFVFSFRAFAASGSSFISRAAARRASVSARTSGAAAARTSSALAALPRRANP